MIAVHYKHAEEIIAAVVAIGADTTRGRPCCLDSCFRSSGQHYGANSEVVTKQQQKYSDF